MSESNCINCTPGCATSYRVRLLIEGDDFPPQSMTSAQIDELPEGSYEIIGTD
ncbi:hypothetical protein [Kineosporia babensis]|uniref:Uncharacterized protein n=1 Tax=Kineosporia babensis TaxID=499548 RepID=A0A9X1NB62_9ACTN|nr:hypothetical protein [Kineosporia babensis]MCD5310880.1 hypothetical protein [Kineosporia babensis]